MTSRSIHERGMRAEISVDLEVMRWAAWSASRIRLQRVDGAIGARVGRSLSWLAEVSNNCYTIDL